MELGRELVLVQRPELDLQVQVLGQRRLGQDRLLELARELVLEWLQVLRLESGLVLAQVRQLVRQQIGRASWRERV